MSELKALFLGVLLVILFQAMRFILLTMIICSFNYGIVFGIDTILKITGIYILVFSMRLNKIFGKKGEE